MTTEHAQLGELAKRRYCLGVAVLLVAGLSLIPVVGQAFEEVGGCGVVDESAQIPISSVETFDSSTTSAPFQEGVCSRSVTASVAPGRSLASPRRLDSSLIAEPNIEIPTSMPAWNSLLEGDFWDSESSHRTVSSREYLGPTQTERTEDTLELSRVIDARTPDDPIVMTVLSVDF